MQAGINRINPFSLARRINRPLILDGAIGSLLQQDGVPADKKSWVTLANLNYPDKVLKIHRDYITAGADIITTNTFRTNPTSLENYSSNEQLNLLRFAVSLAKKAVNNLPVLIAGSNGPAEDCYQKERKISFNKLQSNHYKHIDLLIDNGCDFILNETQSHFDEIRIICEYCAKHEFPYIMSIYVDENLRLLSGEDFNGVTEFIREHSPLAIGINCISSTVFRKIETNFSHNWGFYLNCGSGSTEDEIIECGIDPDEYLNYVKPVLKYFPSFIGACCGSDPSHIKMIKDFLDGKIRS
jgi:methionine synthase I (cobalamin-dependent)